LLTTALPDSLLAAINDGKFALNSHNGKLFLLFGGVEVNYTGGYKTLDQWIPLHHGFLIRGIHLHPKPGDEAEDFRLPDLKGNFISLSRFRGKIVLLTFWAEWCSPCRDHILSLEQLYRRFGRDDLEILAVSEDVLGSSATLPFSEKHQLTLPIVHDPEQQISPRYDAADSVPTTYVIDRRGIIIMRISGARDWNSPQATEMIKQLLNR